MILSSKGNSGQSLLFLRNICIYSALECNHYKVLGLNPSASQSEIKSAFYELSKKHHPDKNQGCEKSAKKFKDITAAYEILRNQRLRLQYDRELFANQSSGLGAAASYSKADYNDEVERSYYEKTSKMKSRRGYGKTPHYNFDAWYKAHYVDFANERFYTGRKNYRYRTVKYDTESFKLFSYSPLYIIIGGLLLIYSYHYLQKKK